jgi:hypothetical protein
MSMGSRDGLQPEDVGAPESGASGERTDGSSSRRRVWLLVGGIVAAVVIISLVVVFFLTRSGGDPLASSSTPSASASASSTAVPTASPTAAPTATPSAAPVETAGPVALPTDCYKIFDQAYLDTYGSAELNSPLLEPIISRIADVEALRASLPGIECRWGGPTEGGTASSVNAVTPAQQDEAIALAVANGASCEDWQQGTKCRIFERLDEWYTAEEYFFRDGLWVSTWLAGTIGDENTITDEMTSSIESTLWP